MIAAVFVSLSSATAVSTAAMIAARRERDQKEEARAAAVESQKVAEQKKEWESVNSSVTRGAPHPRWTHSGRSSSLIAS